MHRRTLIRSALALAASQSLAASPSLASAQAETPAQPADPLFMDWMQGFIERAAGAGWSAGRIRAAFQGLQPDARVIAADSRQPELSKPIGDYIAAAVSDRRVEDGRAYRQAVAALLDPAAARYGVQAEVLVAIWGVESGFGANQGGLDVIRSLATLAAAGRRKAFAEAQLLAALRILFTDQASRQQLKGSWAGAMGQTQFTPQDYLDFAVDGDGDGRRDIWGSSADALASSANFLARKAAWRRGEPSAWEAVLPAGFDYGLSEGPRLMPEQWWAMGVRPAAAHRTAVAEPAQLLLPAGWTGPAFLAFPNHFAIRVYNNSQSYALSVGLLADRIAGGGPLARPWPKDQPTTRADRIAAQEALARMGYDIGAIDGVPGLKTRTAARAWQKTQGLPADGYLTYTLIQRLKTEGGVPASTPPPPPPPPA